VRTHNNDWSDTCNWNATENGQFVFKHIKVLVDQPNTEDILKLILLEEIAEFLHNRWKTLCMFIRNVNGRKGIVGCKHLKVRLAFGYEWQKEDKRKNLQGDVEWNRV
jgi:hypothetical protein